MRPLILVALLAGCGPVQITTDGIHAEAYFSFDGKKLVLMALRSGDKADQIYELDFATRSLTRVSDGRGKAT